MYHPAKWRCLQSSLASSSRVHVLLQSAKRPPPVLTSSARPFTIFPNLRHRGLRRLIAEKTSNKFDEKRVKEIGPDLAALEWLMECGATQVEMFDGARITRIKEMHAYLNRYLISEASAEGSAKSGQARSTIGVSSKGTVGVPKSTVAIPLPGQMAHHVKWPGAPLGAYIRSVDATDAAIADEGFRYLSELRDLQRLKLNFCDYFGDDALRVLAQGRLAKTLIDIEIVANPWLSDGAVYWLCKLSSLRRAHFYLLLYVTNYRAFTRALRLALPRCTVTFPEPTMTGLGYEEGGQKKEG